MITVQVDAPGGHYPIHIGSGRLDRLADSLPADATAIGLVTNTTVAPLYAQRAEQALAAVGVRVVRVELPDGESYKTWHTLNLVFDALLQNGFDRKAVLVALGGGVVGDICGFAAATYMRGIRFLQVPTTVLAQVDSSVGGKTGVNHPLGKNMIGAFHQPVGVEIDIDVLASLPDRELSAGLAEAIKHGMIADAAFFAWCEDNASALRGRDPDAMLVAIRRSCEIKAQVVSQDEREAGVRALLNFGHTFGHAIEAGLGYGQWLHGEAVGCGMVQAAELSARVLGLAPESVARIRALVDAVGCPVDAPDLGTDRWLDLMRVDKKTQGGQLRFIMLPEIGKAVIRPVVPEIVAKVLEDTVVNGSHGTRDT